MLEVSFLKYKMKNERLQEKIFPNWEKNLKNKRNKWTKQEDCGFYFAQYQTPVILFNVLLTKFCIYDQTISHR